eukprot:10905751-Heterocapsa_arctica.AAC.1
MCPPPARPETGPSRSSSAPQSRPPQPRRGQCPLTPHLLHVFWPRPPDLFAQATPDSSGGSAGANQLG